MGFRSRFAVRLAPPGTDGSMTTSRNRSNATRLSFLVSASANCLGQLLARLAGQTGQLLNLTKVGNGLSTTWNTLESHTRLLEDLFLLERLPAWGKTLKARSVAAPKLHMIDAGVAARLMRVSPQKLAGLDQTSLTEFGNLSETFVVGELRKQASWLDEPVTVGHWRTHDDDEVDHVVEFGDGSVVAFEVKANERVSAKDRIGMRKLRDLLGDRFIAGVVFSTGARSFTSDDERIHVMPVDRLWRPVKGKDRAPPFASSVRA